MTVQEAKMQIQAIPSKIWEQLSPCDNEAMGIAIKCMEEVEQYRALGTPTQILERIGGLDVELGKYACLGTVEELKEAREKQIPKKPIMKTVVFCDEAEDVYVCSVCESEIGLFKGQPYCENCGTKVDWGEEDEV